MPEFLLFYLSLSRNPVCTQEQTGSRTYMSEKTAKRNEDNRFLHFHVANFFKFMAANLSFTQFVTWAKPLYLPEKAHHSRNKGMSK